MRNNLFHNIISLYSIPLLIFTISSCSQPLKSGKDNSLYKLGNSYLYRAIRYDSLNSGIDTIELILNITGGESSQKKGFSLSIGIDESTIGTWTAIHGKDTILKKSETNIYDNGNFYSLNFPSQKELRFLKILKATIDPSINIEDKDKTKEFHTYQGSSTEGFLSDVSIKFINQVYIYKRNNKDKNYIGVHSINKSNIGTITVDYDFDIRIGFTTFLYKLPNKQKINISLIEEKEFI